jgi:hypothetical protein
LPEALSVKTRSTSIPSASSPYLLAVNDRLYLFWRGIPDPDDPRIYYSWRTTTDSRWQPQRAITFTHYDPDGVPEEHFLFTSHSPTAVMWANGITLAWKGQPGDSGLYITSQGTDGDWNGQDRPTWPTAERLPRRRCASGTASSTWPGAAFASSFSTTGRFGSPRSAD